MFKRMFLCTIIAVGLLAFVCQAQAEEKVTEFTFGTVQSVDTAANCLVIKEYDYETDGDISVTYTVNADTEFENAESLAGVVAGSEADVEFFVDPQGKKTATYVGVMNPLSGEEEIEEEETEDYIED